MGKKRQNGANQAAVEPFSGNLGSPFADLKVDVPPPPEELPPPPPPSREEVMESKLSQADKRMLEEFRRSGLVPEPITREPGKTSRIRLNVSIQKKGHKGRVVTNIKGLENLSFEERMDICSELKNALGCGARFVDTILEVQGDQRERLVKILGDRNFVFNI